VATRLPTASRNATTNAVTALVDADVGAGTIQIRTGAQPASADNAATGTLLATITLADPAWSASVAGVSTLDATPVLSTTGVAAGTAGWFRMLDNSGDTVVDGAVTVTGGGGELELNTTTISIGVTVDITAGTLTTPASTP
jgi:hypothetical protein